MYITVSKEAGRVAGTPRFAAQVAQVVMGQMPWRQVALNDAAGEAGSLAVEVAASDLDRGAQPGRAQVLVVFQFKSGKADTQALKRYVGDREPALQKHGGRVLLSGTTARSGDWQFDGFELIEFPEPKTLQALMEDPDYRGRTADSSAVFGGAFAVALLQPAGNAA
ncbi:DUF1330 domain-containing protein [Aquabacterium sp. A7-Y]|uniref:DUF1330 domain-containing protein n=1 Tax=Aquabacterium sp. A7-Y TaxID=1349605 RepID=UPI00223DD876|nr:DUF1330 domain-containing protein [Aquabacterium sp. A7-Y]MCW7536892.1 DUF1330 domain-containing protein [Aquabacterium sp. A7-Y]